MNPSQSPSTENHSLQRRLRAPCKMSIIPCHYLSSSAPIPKITVLYITLTILAMMIMSLSAFKSLRASCTLSLNSESSELKLSSSSGSSAQLPQVSRKNWADWSAGFSTPNVISQLIIVQGSFPSDGVSSGTGYALPGRSGSYGICKLLARPCRLSNY